MRKILLTLVMACLVGAPALAQRGMFGRGGDMSGLLLTNKDVQKELKLTEDQTNAIAKAQKDVQAAFTKARKDRDQDAGRKAFEDYQAAVTKVKDKLTEAQKKRLLGIQVQLAEKTNAVGIFKNKAVASALKLNEKQKDILADYDKDVKDAREDAGGDFRKMGQAIQRLNKENFAKITRSFSDEQKRTWKELEGAPAEVKFEGFGFRPKGGRGPQRDKPKNED